MFQIPMLEKSKMVRKCQSTVTSHCRLSVLADNLHLRVGDLPLHVLRLLLARGTSSTRSPHGHREQHGGGGGGKGGGHPGVASEAVMGQLCILIK